MTNIDNNFENMIDEMADFTAETLSKEEETKQRMELRGTLSRVADMLRSKSFSRKCKDQAKKYGVSEKHIKNMYAANLLDKLGAGINVTAELIGEAFNYLVRFIGYVLQRVMDIAVSVIHKVVNVVTFRREVA